MQDQPSSRWLLLIHQKKIEAREFQEMALEKGFLIYIDHSWGCSFAG
jgi:hypothetical protein